MIWALREYRAEPAMLVSEWSLIVFGVVVTGCLTLAKGPMALRRWQVAVFVGVAAACAVSEWVNAKLAYLQAALGGGVMVRQWGLDIPSLPGIIVNGTVPLVMVATFLAVAASVPSTVDPGLRRRLRAYAWVPLPPMFWCSPGRRGWR